MGRRASSIKCIIAGSRTTEYHHVVKAIQECPFTPQITEVVCGGCEGADLHGKTWADKLNIPVKFFLPQWSEYGKSAGPIRNTKMAEYAAPDGALILVWSGTSPGSAHMLRTARTYKLRVYEYIYGVTK